VSALEPGESCETILGPLAAYCCFRSSRTQAWRCKSATTQPPSSRTKSGTAEFSIAERAEASGGFDQLMH
jgi:hypothetical protein